MLTLLTATGCRPLAWALCERWMQAQTYTGPVRWVIVDDGETAQPITFERAGWTLDVVRPKPFWQPGQNTQARNLLAGLAVIRPHEHVAIIEDDDHYKADWLDVVDRELKRAELVGECLARYYNIASGVGRQLNNNRHASLCSTAVRGHALQFLRRACERKQKYIDLDLWRGFRPSRLFDGHRVTGIKGLTGRTGIGMGHAADFSGTRDADRTLLRSWIGADADAYIPTSQEETA